MKAVIFDADGTLVDSVYFFIEVYYQAYKELGVHLPRAAIHRVVGIGCDKAVAMLTSETWGRAHGARLRARAVELYHDRFLPRVELFPEAETVCRELKARGFSLALASSSSSDIVDHYLSLFSDSALFDFVNTSSHKLRTKPDPDIFLDIVTKGGFAKAHTVVIGDSVWDVKAAKAAELTCMCVLTGGYHADELRAEGAVEIYADVAALLANLDRSVIMQRT